MKTFKKTEKQKEATRLMAGEANNVMLYGGSRSGKTFQIVRSIIVRACKERSRHVSFRQRFNHAKTSLWLETIPKVLELCFPDLDVKSNKTDYYITFPNGSEYWVAGLDDKNRTEKVLGKEYSTIHFNECSQISYESVQVAKTRLAEQNGLKKKLYYDENPPHKTHWSYWNFIKKVDPESSEGLPKPEAFQSLLMNPEDNIENIDQSYITDVLEQLPSDQQARFRFGRFLDNQGGFIYWGFNRESSHTDMTYDSSLPLIIGMDFNNSPLTACVFQKVGSSLLQVDEVFLQSSDTPEMCRVIKERYPNSRAVFRPDATGSRKTTNASQSDHQIIQSHGFQVQSGKTNPFRVDRYAAVNRALERGQVKINTKKCPKTVKDLERLVYKEGTSEPDLKDPMMGHISDAFGYAVFKEFPITGKIQIGQYA